MKKPITLLLLSIVAITAQAQSSLEGFHRFILTFTGKYAPEMRPLVKFHNWDQQMFISDGKNYLEGLPTYFHEQLHLLNDSLTYGLRSTSRLYFIDGKTYEIKRQPVFKTFVIDAIVPKEIRVAIPRYRLYTNGESRLKDVPLNPDTRENGIYGLAEEFLAYYYSNLAYAKLYGYLKEQYAFDKPVWYDYLGARSSFVNTYYEFRLFIGYYFLYAKANYPEIYRALVQDASLVNLIKTTDAKFKQLIDGYWVDRSEIIQKSKKTIQARNGYLISRFTNVRYMLPEDDMQLLKSKYTTEMSSIMNFER